MSTLANVLEAHGLATIALTSVRGQAESAKPPRGLQVNFPLGRPLGRPDDAEFQISVLTAAFDLLSTPADEIPVLVDFPVEILDEADAVLSCAMPPSDDHALPAAVSEARALRPAYERSLAKHGRTTVGKAIQADAIPDAVAMFVAIAEGTPWDEAGLPGDPTKVAADIRNYYEEAALSLSDAVPAARQAEAWFYEETAAGAALHGAQRAMKDADANSYFTLYLMPMTRSRA